ncbi:MAG: hypothetical protein AUJ57_03125 [Zetaproteobacteria bacterium CG1_02_53_45]|nr:MAG: hypothetical protein AUJ57_03125 [Zetaproteobacteria bacterium CG1_02_53_45]
MFLCSGSLIQAQDAEGFYVEEPEFNARVYMLEAGKSHRDTVLLVHGLGDSGSNDWSDVIPALAKHYHVIAMDLPGFARSEKGNHLYSPTRYARFLKWVVDQYSSYRNQRPVTMIGHSLGGAIALRYASMYPETMNKLVLVDAAGILHRSAYASAAVHHRRNRLSLLNMTSTRPKEIGQWLGDLIISSENVSLPVDEVLSSPRMRALFLRQKPSAIAALALLQENFSRAIYELHLPTCIIWGENDGVAPLRTGRLLYARLNSSSLDVISHANHIPMKEQTAEFNRLLLHRLTQTTETKNQSEGSFTAVKNIECVSQKNMHISGSYHDIFINKCRGVKLENVTARNIHIDNSDVDIYDSQVRSLQTGIVVRNSTLTATALDIYAETGISTSASKLDLAGVSIQSNKEAVISSGGKQSTALISVSKFQNGYIHGIYKFPDNKN